MIILHRRRGSCEQREGGKETDLRRALREEKKREILSYTCTLVLVPATLKQQLLHKK
jgi:hypothetical protein